MLTVVRLKLPTSLRRSLACTNAIENMVETVRQSQREALAQCRDGDALDGRRNDGSGQGLQSRDAKLCNRSSPWTPLI
jgi:hypothetical protein